MKQKQIHECENCDFQHEKKNALILHQRYHCKNKKEQKKQDIHICDFRDLEYTDMKELKALEMGYKGVCDKCQLLTK